MGAEEIIAAALMESRLTPWARSSPELEFAYPELCLTNHERAARLVERLREDNMNIPPEPGINTWVPHCETCEEGYPDPDGDCQECGEPCDMEPPEDPCDRTLEDHE